MVSNRLITQSHNLPRFSTKLKNPGDLISGTNHHEGSAMYDNRADIIAVYMYKN